jgi:hypothetical protein
MASSTIEVKVVGDASSAVRALHATGNAADSLGSKAGGRLASGLKIAGLAALGLAGVVGTGLAVALKTGFGELKEAESALATSETLIKNLGSATSITTGDIEGWASALQGMTGIPDDVIMSAENTLLRFESLAGDEGVFQRTTAVAADMSVALGKDLPAAALVLGKALADPETAAGKLARAGVVLNEEQQKTIDKFIEAGDKAGALEYLLGLLETKFGGVAEAAGDTTAGKIEILKRKFEDISEALATRLMPYADRFIDWLGRLMDAGSVSGALGEIASGLGSIGKEILTAITGKIAEINWVDVGKTVFNAIVGSIRTAFGAGTNLAEQLGIGPALQTALGVVVGGLTGLLIASKVAGAVGTLAGSVVRLVGGLGSLAGALLKIPLPILGAVIAIGAVAAAIIWIDKLTDANKELKDAVDAAKLALDGQKTAADGLVDAERGLEDAHLRVEQAALVLASAESEVARLTGEGKTGTDDYAQAQLNLEAAKLESTRAAEDLTGAELALKDATVLSRDATEGANDALVDVYKNMDVTKSKSDELGGRVDYVRGQFDSLGGQLGNVQLGLQDVGGAAQGASPKLTGAAGQAEVFAGAAGTAANKAGDLADKIRDIPDSHRTHMQTTGADAAANAANSVNNAVRNTPTYWETHMVVIHDDLPGGTVGQNAIGTRNWRGGWSVVGERGPELVNLPAGSDIYSNTETRGMLSDLEPFAGGRGWSGGQTVVNVYVNVAGSVMTEQDLATKIRDALESRSQGLTRLFSR